MHIKIYFFKMVYWTLLDNTKQSLYTENFLNKKNTTQYTAILRPTRRFCNSTLGYCRRKYKNTSWKCRARSSSAWSSVSVQINWNSGSGIWNLFSRRSILFLNECILVFQYLNIFCISRSITLYFFAIYTNWLIY